MRHFFKQFSFPGGIGSHATPETPGSLHEGGELGYSVSHAFGTVFDHPNLIALTVVGDGESETGPLATSWHGNKFLNPITDGAVLPVLHLNGYIFVPPIPNPVLNRLKLHVGTRSIIPLFLLESPTKSLKHFSVGMDGLHTSSKAPTLIQCIKQWQLRSSVASRKSKAIKSKREILENTSVLDGQ